MSLAGPAHIAPKLIKFDEGELICKKDLNSHRTIIKTGNKYKYTHWVKIYSSTQEDEHSYSVMGIGIMNCPCAIEFKLKEKYIYGAHRPYLYEYFLTIEENREYIIDKIL